MTAGAAPGERRGGRAKGVKNKLTIGRAYRAYHEAKYLGSFDGSLTRLAELLIAVVSDPYDRQELGEVIDRYIDARERADKQSKRSRSVGTAVEAVTNPKPNPLDLMVADCTLELESGFDSLK
jgi:hypothetical protein